MVCVKMVNNLACYTEKRCKDKEVIKLLSHCMCILVFFLFFFLSTPLNLVYSIDVLIITFMQAMMKMESFYVENSGLSLKQEINMYSNYVS